MGKMNKKRRSKRGLSVVIGYVLLITFGIILSAIVYQYLRTFVPSDIDQCPSDVSIFIQDYSCSANQLNLTLKNNGKFNMQGYFLYAANSSNDSLATINLAKYFDSSLSQGLSNNVSIYFNINPYENFTSGDIRYNVFSGLPKQYYSIDIIPARFQKIGGTQKFVSCGNSEIMQVLSC